MKVILGYKRGMARIFDEQGVAVPVTVVEAGPCTVTQVKTPDTDGYGAVQLGFGEIKPERLNRPQSGHLKASGAGAVRHLREFRSDDPGGYSVGDTVDAGTFSPGDRVHVTGVSRGMGFAGTIKRHGFHRQPKTHGQSDRERAPGSVGAGTTPGKTFKGHRMSGRMGGDKVTTRNVSVVTADPERNLLALKGSVPGPRGGLVLIRAVEEA